ncbi:ISAs1 family transposase [uncultured Microscilla sp.]|uniref:ISAs1 family transposase n=1 Tax=uncultured Microscilla sp. TaxID=432653 RepID=UPI00261BB144|nr:ISAs1 family transposase [uncultured Microscilla sp.]
MHLGEIFSSVPDPRRETANKLHKLTDILTISLLATISGCDNDEEIEEYGIVKEQFLRKFLALPHGIPSHDTFTRVLNVVNPEKFSEVLYAHTNFLLDFLEEHHISIDGKVLRATKKRGKSNRGLCILTAWVCKQKLVLGQLKTDQKSNEKTAIPELLEHINVESALVSIDAIGNSPDIAEQIVEGGGHYLLSLKKNQKTAFEQVQDFMKARQQICLNDQQKDFGSGRIETRTCYVSNEVHLMEKTQDWKNIESVIMVHAIREFEEQTQEEYRFYLSDKKESPKYFNEKVREHWSIENHLHWQLDVSFNEDKSRTVAQNGAENRNTLRKLALQMLKQVNDKHSIAVRRKKASWDDEYLMNILGLYVRQ